MNDASVFIISGDNNFKNALYHKLKIKPGLRVDTSALSVTMAASQLVRGKLTIMILDADNQKLDNIYLRQLCEKFLLSVIVASRNPAILIDSRFAYVHKPIGQSPSDFYSAANVISLKVSVIVDRTPVASPVDLQNAVDSRSKIIAVASSTGGTEALSVVLPDLRANIPPVLIVQHMPSGFTKQFADRLNKMSQLAVKEAENGEYIRRGTAYIAPGDLHMRMVVRQQKLALECFYGDKMHGVRPAADILFDSVAKLSGGNSVGVILTGMGADGARGLMEMHGKGARVIGQDKESSVVYGMPKAAYDLGAVDYQLPLNKIAAKITELA